MAASRQSRAAYGARMSASASRQSSSRSSMAARRSSSMASRGGSSSATSGGTATGGGGTATGGGAQGGGEQPPAEKPEGQTPAAPAAPAAPATPATPASADPAKTGAMSQNSIMSTALNQMQSQKLNEGENKEFVPDAGPGQKELYCEPNGVEGKWSYINDQMKEKCKEEVKAKKELTDKIAQASKAAGKPNCEIKVDKASQICHTQRVLKKIVTDPEYKMSQYGNVVEFTIKDVPVLMAIAEVYNYDIEKMPIPSKKMLRNPGMEVVFNKLGGVLTQRGDMPTSPKDDPCAKCLEALNKNATTLDGASENCGSNCEVSVLVSMLQSGHFREIGNSNAAQPGTKPSTGEEGGQTGDGSAQGGGDQAQAAGG